MSDDAVISGAERPVRRIGRRKLTIRQVKVYNVRIRVGQWLGRTDRPPLLIFNGIGASLELLGPLADALEDTTVIAFDVPGAGESELPPIPYRMWMLGNLVGRLLNTLDVDRVDVLGVSWGGAAAQQFALQNPRRCRRLILAATSPGVIMVPPKMSVLAKFITPRRFNDRDYLHSVAGDIYGGKAKDGGGEAIQKFRGTSHRGYLMQQLALAGWTSLPWLRCLQQPTLVLHGTDDRVVRPVNGRILNALLTNSRMRTLADGHLFVISSAEETAHYLLPFLAGEEPPPQLSPNKPIDQSIKEDR